MIGIVLLISSWAVYFFFHSLLAAEGIKRWAKNKMKSFFRYYRLGYVIFSLVGLVLLLLLNASIPSKFYFRNSGMIRYLSLILSAFGVIIIKVSFREYDIRSFVGLNNVDHGKLNTNGILSKVRHPIYLGTILVVIGFFLFSPNLPTLVSMLCIFIYLPIGIFLEEKKLIKAFGDDYLAYKKSVPALFYRLF